MRLASYVRCDFVVNRSGNIVAVLRDPEEWLAALRGRPKQADGYEPPADRGFAMN